ncbi:MAG: hypothetical protein BroJett029_04630 [Alphaproteobacteria bacterium]|nr:MAG: hypothetical protein BroJett029_04630 [Alphaproteobacteria bacterium]
MIRYFSKLMKLVAVLLVAGMAFHGAAAAAHSMVCPDAPELADNAGHTDDPTESETATVTDNTHHGSHDGTQDPAGACHSAMSSCAECLAREAVSLTAPSALTIAFPHTAVSFPSLQPGAAHRPPIAVG